MPQNAAPSLTSWGNKNKNKKKNREKSATTIIKQAARTCGRAEGHEANSLAYMAAFSAYTCRGHVACSMRHVAACHEWHTNVAATRLDATQPNSAQLDFAPTGTVSGASTTCGMGGTCSLLPRCHVATLQPLLLLLLQQASCIFCLLKCRKCCGSQQAVASGGNSSSSCSLQLAPNGCKQQMLSACPHTHAHTHSCYLDWHWNCTVCGSCD